uniref:Uncharacterized protein n=1 Tax=Anguilla anguilla TaxID=7936 RepID=A0A0E9XTP0_ANGAN
MFRLIPPPTVEIFYRWNFMLKVHRVSS